MYWIGGNDRQSPRFESDHPVPRGMSYNSYLLLDEKTVLFDTVDRSVQTQFFENLEHTLATGSWITSLSTTWSPTMLPPWGI
mgnify:CR=1 FL=1